MSKNEDLRNYISSDAGISVAARGYAKAYDADNGSIARFGFEAGARWAFSQVDAVPPGASQVTAHDLAGFETRLMNFLHAIGKAAGNDFARVERAIDEVQLEQQSILSLIEAVHGLAAPEEPVDYCGESGNERLDAKAFSNFETLVQKEYDKPVDPAGPSGGEVGKIYNDTMAKAYCEEVERLVPRMTGVDMAKPGADGTTIGRWSQDGYAIIKIPEDAGRVLNLAYIHGVTFVFCVNGTFKLDGLKLIKL